MVRQILILCGLMALLGALSVLNKIRLARSLQRRGSGSSMLSTRSRRHLWVRYLIDALILFVALFWYLHRR